MSIQSVPQPGWYPNQNGQLQWWDGQQWGQIAAPSTVMMRPAKDTGVAYLLAILLGGFAAHRFYLGRVGSAIGFLALWWGGWLLTAVVVGFAMLAAAFIRWIVDLCILRGMTRAANGQQRL